MAEKFSAKWFYVGNGTYQVEKGLINKTLVDKVSQRMPDFGEFAKNLASMYEQFDGEGYDVVNVLPINLGTSEQNTQRDGTYVGDVGFSITRGAVVVGKKRNP
jgi:hypothetical protein